MAGRYQSSERLKYTSPNGVTVAYLAPRILPLGLSAAGQGRATIGIGEVNRLDLLAYRTLGAAEQGWRLADANDAMDPFELCASPGRTVRLPDTPMGAA